MRAWRRPASAAQNTTGAMIPNLAPMVDVIMVLLVFFIIGASIEYAREGVLRTELDPRSGPGAGIALDIIPEVKIGLEAREGGNQAAVYLMGRPLGVQAFPALASELRARRDAGADLQNPVVIGAQPGVRWGLVVRAMDVAVASGFKNVQFATSLGGEQP